MVLLMELPAVVLEEIARGVLGIDLLHLSQANKDARQFFSQEALWSWRLSATDLINVSRAIGSAKKQYLCTPRRSLYFDGDHSLDSRGRIVRGNAIPLRPLGLAELSYWGPFVTFDLWFSVPKGSNGGIVLGGQDSNALLKTSKPESCQQFILVDKKLNLYCSLVATQQFDTSFIKKHSPLQTDRWYHLALTYGDRTERVFVDGELVSRRQLTLNDQWFDMRCMQLGTGSFSAVNGNHIHPGAPSPSFKGYYGFSGYIDDFRIWSGLVPEEHVAELAAGKTLDGMEPSYTLTHDAENLSRSTAPKFVRSSRPMENGFQVYPSVKRDDGKKKLLASLKMPSFSKKKSSSKVA